MVSFVSPIDQWTCLLLLVSSWTTVSAGSRGAGRVKMPLPQPRKRRGTGVDLPTLKLGLPVRLTISSICREYPNRKTELKVSKGYALYNAPSCP